MLKRLWIETILVIVILPGRQRVFLGRFLVVIRAWEVNAFFGREVGMTDPDAYLIEIVVVGDDFTIGLLA